MKILVFSDSHGIVAGMKAAIGLYPEITYIIHLGDGEADVAALRRLYPSYTIEAVRGNCDVQKALPAELTVEAGGQRIFATHGNCYGVKYGLDSLVAEGIQQKAGVILFGHTHRPLIERRDGILIVNPGSIAGPYCAPRATYAVLTLTDSRVSAEGFVL